ncbi:MAG: cyclic nucleotide-binding domain-containing protein [Alphaproteobacteria bacterium]|nr:cyclic nucleotide-binding domain-containing protein [Alphaproteobacteria bacterium]
MQSTGTILSSLKTEDYEAVSHVDLFSDLTLDEVQRLLKGAIVRSHPKGALLFSQGDPADRFYVVLEGTVKLFKTTEAGDQGVVEVFGGGHSFGEAATFLSKRFPVGAEVIADAKLVHVPASSFIAELSRSPDLSFKLLASLSRHYRRLVRQIGQLKMKSPGQRLGCYILSLTSETEGPANVELPDDKGLVAGRIGITPESLSRALTRLREVGVQCQGRQVVIDDMAALRSFCNVEEDEPDTSDKSCVSSR